MKSHFTFRFVYTLCMSLFILSVLGLRNLRLVKGHAGCLELLHEQFKCAEVSRVLGSLFFVIEVS